MNICTLLTIGAVMRMSSAPDSKYDDMATDCYRFYGLLHGFRDSTPEAPPIKGEKQVISEMIAIASIPDLEQIRHIWMSAQDRYHRNNPHKPLGDLDDEVAGDVMLLLFPYKGQEANTYAYPFRMTKGGIRIEHGYGELSFDAIMAIIRTEARHPTGRRNLKPLAKLASH